MGCGDSAPNPARALLPLKDQATSNRSLATASLVRGAKPHGARSFVKAARPSLSDRVAAALARPSDISRFGGLSLGESTHLVDELRALGPADHGEGRLLVGDIEGDLALPVWPDHVGAAGTRWGQYRLVPATVSTEPDERAWTIVRRPDAERR
jgi:hypothetical protein